MTVGYGEAVWNEKFCLMLLNMDSSGIRTVDHFILSSVLYRGGHMLPVPQASVPQVIISFIDRPILSHYSPQCR